MDEMRKISLDDVKSQQYSVESVRKRKIPKKIAIPLIVFISILALFIFGIVLPVAATYGTARVAYSQVRVAVDSAKKQDVAATSEELKKTHEALLATQRNLRMFSYVKFIPFIGAYYSDADHIVQAGVYGLEAVQITVDSILPYADVLGLKGQGSFVLGSAEERIKKAVETLDKVTPKISEIEGKVTLLKKEMDEVNPSRYPNVGTYKIGSQLKEAKTSIDQIETLVTDARPLAEALPTLLGAKENKKYLVIFQNDKELRPTGGFITAYAIFRMEKGRPVAEAADDIYTLDGRRTKRLDAPELIEKYLPAIAGGKTTEWQMRDANLSPDFKVSMMQVNEFYSQVPGRADVDGIIAVDTQFLVEVVRILGGIDVYGKKFTAEDDPRCNCPNVVYELSDAITRPVGFVRSGRKDVIGVLLSGIMQKSLSSSPKIYWGPLFQAGLTGVQEKHILFYLFDENAQKGLEALNAAGRIKDYSGDYLHINDANLAGAKSNMYVRETVTQDIRVESDGNVVKTLVIDYKNPQPASDCNLERGGLCLNGILRNVVRVYVPLGSSLLENQGFEKGPEVYEELGKTVFEGFMTVKPEGKATVTVKYRLPNLSSGTKKGSLPLLIQKQPGTEGYEYLIKVNGKDVQKFNLREDKEIMLTL